jgi:hypothetical protein
MAAAFEQYGFDCYTQGCVDGATTASMRPDLVHFIDAERAAEPQPEKR